MQAQKTRRSRGVKERRAIYQKNELIKSSRDTIRAKSKPPDKVLTSSNDLQIIAFQREQTGLSH
jgi:hypothetical protein